MWNPTLSSFMHSRHDTDSENKTPPQTKPQKNKNQNHQRDMLIKYLHKPVHLVLCRKRKILKTLASNLFLSWNSCCSNGQNREMWLFPCFQLSTWAETKKKSLIDIRKNLLTWGKYSFSNISTVWLNYIYIDFEYIHTYTFWLFEIGSHYIALAGLEFIL